MPNHKIEIVINYLVAQNIHFALYSLPNSKHLQLAVEQNASSKEKFILQAFDTAQKSIAIHQDLYFEESAIDLATLKEKLSIFPKEKSNKTKEQKTILKQKDYEKYVQQAIDLCKDANNSLSKIVTSRIKKVEQTKDFNLGKYFVALNAENSTAFVHLSYHSKSGLWLGATPEILVKQNTPQHYETVALAGTKLKAKNRSWTKKEIEEQQIVTDYIVDSLNKNECINIDLSAVETIDAGLVQHLKTKIKFQSKNSIENIAKILHPTPAVCGMPKQKAFDFIQEKEGKQRHNYTGYIAIDTATTKVCFVNLRCMQIIENVLYAYVGGGILKNSEPIKEWQETENKAQTLLKFFS